MQIFNRFEVMEAMSMEQQSAYDRLYRWVKDQFASLKDDPSDINEYLITAVSTLQEKQPVLLRYHLMCQYLVIKLMWITW